MLGRSSVMRIEDGAPRVEGGEVRFSVPHRQPGHPFVVRAEGYRVVVVGTRFGVNVAGKAPTLQARRQDSTARPTQDGRRRRRRGDRRGLGGGHRAAARAAHPGRELAEPRRRRRGAGGARRGRAGARAERGRADDPAPAPAASATGASTPAARTLALASPGDGAATERRARPAEAPTAEAAAARAALASGDAPRALQLYRTLAQGTGPSAENASYEIGKVLNEKMGQPPNAVAAWRHYRAAYPDGILRVEADVSIIETLGAHRRERRGAVGGERVPAAAPRQRAARRDRAAGRRSLPRARRLPPRPRGLPGRARRLAPARRRRGRRLPPRGLPGPPGRRGRPRRRARLPARLPERQVPRRSGGAGQRVRAAPVGRAVTRRISLGCALLAGALARLPADLVLDDRPPDAGRPGTGGSERQRRRRRAARAPATPPTDGRCFGARPADCRHRRQAAGRRGAGSLDGDDRDAVRRRRTTASSTRAVADLSAQVTTTPSGEPQRAGGPSTSPISGFPDTRQRLH